MPTIDDYDQNEEKQGGAGDFVASAPTPSARAPGSGGSTPPPTGASPQHEETFVPWSRFTSANQEVSDREAGKLQKSVQNDVNAAGSARDSLAAAQKQGIESNYGNGTPAPSAQTVAEHPIGGATKPMEAPTPAPTPAPSGGGLTNEALNSPQGAKDLETQAGADAWAKLLGQTKKAGDEANALGTTTGVQGLIQDRSSQPLAQNGAFDAALEQQAGGEGFQQLNKQYGNGQLLNQLAQADAAAQERWQKLLGDQKAQQGAQRGAPVEPPGPQGQAAPSDQPTSIDEVLFSGDNAQAGSQFWSDFHQAGLSLSPADWASIAAGEAGADAPMATEAYVSAATSPLAAVMRGAWPAAKVKWAFNMVDDQFGQDAMQALAKALRDDPKMKSQYLHMNNPGFMARNMRAWLLDHGFSRKSFDQKPGAHDESHVQQTATGQSFVDKHGQQRTTTDAQEIARNQAYREGWGQSWDDQFADGNDEPSK